MGLDSHLFMTLFFFKTNLLLTPACIWGLCICTMLPTAYLFIPHINLCLRRTCNYVFDGAVFALVDKAAVLALPLPQLGNQLLLLPLAFMRWRLTCGGEGRRKHPFRLYRYFHICSHCIKLRLIYSVTFQINLSINFILGQWFMRSKKIRLVQYFSLMSASLDAWGWMSADIYLLILLLFHHGFLFHKLLHHQLLLFLPLLVLIICLLRKKR